MLLSRYDPLKAGRGKAGIGNNNDDKDDTSMSGLSSSYSRVNWRSLKKQSCGKISKVAVNDDAIKETLSNIVNLVTKSSSNVSPISSLDNTKTTGLTLVDLNSLYDKYVGHLTFLKDNEMLTETQKVDILANIEEVYAMI